MDVPPIISFVTPALAFISPDLVDNTPTMSPPALYFAIYTRFDSGAYHSVSRCSRTYA